MTLDKFKRIDFQLDWSNRYLIGEEVTAVENGDVNGRSIRLQITNMGSIEDLSSYSVVLYWKHTIAGNTGMNSFKAVDPVNGIFEVVLSPEMLLKPGLVQGNIAVINGTSGSQMLITSRLIHIQVEESIMAFSSITATDDYSTLKEIVMLWKELPVVVGDAVDYLHTLTDQVVADAQHAIATSLDQQVAAAIQAGMPSKAEDNAVVHNTGSETIGGTKTFTAPIVGSLQGNASTATSAESADSAKDIAESAALGAKIASIVYPVGSYYMSEVSTSPDVLFGMGTWQRVKGRVLVGVDENDPVLTTAGIDGGSVNPLTRHSHNIRRSNGTQQTAIGATINWSDIPNTGGVIQEAGDNTDHKNWQPFHTAYIWKRTA